MDSYDSNASDYSNYYGGEYDYGDKYMYTGYSFERPFYLYILEVISIITFLGNLVVISVLLRRKMRNPTNMVLTTIAVTDSLTALVVLPTYIMVYTRYYSLSDEGYDNDYDDTNFTDSDYGNYDSGYHNDGAVDGCELTENLCNGFMISKYFLSKSFHSMSIFLTLFLGIQRYISIRFPYKSQSMLNLPRTIVCCGAIVFLSPFLHIYHLFGTRALDGNCQWELSEDGCGTGCIYLWLAFFIRHFTPCMILVVFTVLFIRQLHAGERTLRRMESSQSQISRRKDENRRISLVVTAVVVVFLIPEIPYSIFLLYNAFDKAVNQGKGIDLEANRAINVVYELFLVLSFHANIYIYTFCNRRFRRALLRVYLNPVRRILGTTEILSQSSTLSHKPSNRKTDTGSGITQTEMKPMVKSVPSN
jgi:hypothetical protein